MKKGTILIPKKELIKYGIEHGWWLKDEPNKKMVVLRIDINPKTVFCSICNKTHGPRIAIQTLNNTRHVSAITQCEYKEAIKEKINKLLKL